MAQVSTFMGKVKLKDVITCGMTTVFLYFHRPMKKSICFGNRHFENYTTRWTSCNKNVANLECCNE